MQPDAAARVLLDKARHREYVSVSWHLSPLRDIFQSNPSIRSRASCVWPVGAIAHKTTCHCTCIEDEQKGHVSGKVR